MLMSSRRCAAVFWSTQVDAAALVGEDEVRGGGGGARALGRQRRKTRDREVTKAYGPGLFIRDDS